MWIVLGIAHVREERPKYAAAWKTGDCSFFQKEAEEERWQALHQLKKASTDRMRGKKMKQALL